MSNTIRVKAALLNLGKLILYTETGDEVSIPQGDARLTKILDFIKEPLQTQGYVDLPEEYLDMKNIFHEFEKENKFMKFIRVSKQTLKNLFGNDHLTPRVLGDTKFLDEVENSKLNTVSNEVLDNLVKNGKPSSEPNFTRNIGENDSDDTIVGITEDGVVVPNAHKLTAQINHSLDYKNATGFKNFMARIKPVIKNRGHSIEDLLTFMERGDLPLADDGSIIAYKLLYATDGGRFVDPHSQRVSQTVGSYVNMPINMVDPNRRNECSNGLHVARRGYLGHFYGDNCFIIKINPEDVIAVPEYDANKMRVRGYHIIFHLTQDMMRKLKSNAPITDQKEGQILLSRAIAGDHIRITESVLIQGQNGSNVIITPLDENGNPIEDKTESVAEGRKPIESKVTIKGVVPSAESKLDEIKGVKAIDDKQLKADGPKSGKKIELDEIQKLATTSTNKKINSRSDQARKLYHDFTTAHSVDRKSRIQALQSFKQEKKVSWSILGFTFEEERKIKRAIENLLK